MLDAKCSAHRAPSRLLPAFLSKDDKAHGCTRLRPPSLNVIILTSSSPTTLNLLLFFFFLFSPPPPCVCVCVHLFNLPSLTVAPRVALALRNSLQEQEPAHSRGNKRINLKKERQEEEGREIGTRRDEKKHRPYIKVRVYCLYR